MPVNHTSHELCITSFDIHHSCYIIRSMTDDNPAETRQEQVESWMERKEEEMFLAQAGDYEPA